LAIGVEGITQSPICIALEVVLLKFHAVLFSNQHTREDRKESNTDRYLNLQALDGSFLQFLMMRLEDGGPRKALHPKIMMDTRICPVNTASPYLVISE